MKLQSVFGIPSHRAPAHERLQRLAAFVERIPPDRLTLSRWYARQRGCAVGLAVKEDPWFRAQGLRLVDAEEPGACRPVYEGKSDWPAVAAFFGMTVDEAHTLLHPRGYGGRLRPRPTEMAARIRSQLRALAEPA